MPNEHGVIRWKLAKVVGWLLPVICLAALLVILFVSATLASTARAADRVYWANMNAVTANSMISFANLDGTGGGQLNLTGATPNEPEGVAIDSAAGRIYWANNNNTISFANLDGTGGGGELNITGATPSFPTGVAIDPAAGRIYWANFSNNTISFARLDGTGGGQLDITGATPSGPNFPALLKAPGGASAPAISGAATVGSVLSCSQGTWAPDLLGSFLYRAPQSFAYQWSLGGSDIAGARQSSYTASAPGSYACRVTAQNQAGSASQTSASHPVAGASDAVAACVVPKLKGRKLKAAKKRLRNANCSLGKVKGPKGGKVRKQRPKSGTVLPAGSKVKVTLG